ncbi:Sec-independent protein translocase protein TatC [Corynebacterium provencense]|uniref:Sec-independent protein translocase protein TatC n=1 Tax=Corynebacterium provencense TaxID=1737425 RepID=A0A2Z3YQR7_9CORY|nr:twin-arginine translocase subunit TatC [Corynebacterium provencense]AWT27208.1 Sec-independent protein translocase protein TatC [Corynebacterium provencense]
MTTTTATTIVAPGGAGDPATRDLPRMPLSGHLREARKRITRSALAFAVAAVVAYLLSDAVLDVLRAPVTDIAETRDASINYDSITGAFDLKLKIALYGGIVLSSPVWIHQLVAYVSPALTRREKKYTYGFLAGVLPLFTAGCAVGVLIFPRMVELLTGFASDDDSTLLQASYYFDFVLKLVLAAGVAFTLPAFLVVLNAMGVLSAKTIAHSWRGAVIGIIVFSALVTPAADLMSMFLIAVPMVVLYLVALAVAWLHDRRKRRSEPTC